MSDIQDWLRSSDEPRCWKAADEVERLRKRVEDLEDYIRQHVGVTWPAGYRTITDDQIDAAWACIEENRESGNEDLMQIGDAEERMLHNCFGIVRCEGCGSGEPGMRPGYWSSTSGTPCPECDGHGWVVKDE